MAVVQSSSAGRGTALGPPRRPVLASPTMASLVAPGADVRRAERVFYGGMAGLVLVLVFLGFGPSYYLRPVFRPAQPLSRVLHLHGLVFSVWVALLVTQAALVSARRVDLHRKLGILGAAWAALM